MIATVEYGKESAGVLGIAKDNVKIEDTVKLTAIPNPSVDFLPHGFLFRRVVTGPYGGPFERSGLRRRRPGADPCAITSHVRPGNYICGDYGQDANDETPRQREAHEGLQCHPFRFHPSDLQSLHDTAGQTRWTNVTEAYHYDGEEFYSA